MADSEYFGIQPTNVRDVESRYRYVATAGQTTFPANYEIGYVDTYKNGSKVDSLLGVTAANGTSITLSTGATAGDLIEIVCRRQIQISENNDVYITRTQYISGVGQTSFPHTYTTGSVFNVTVNGIGAGFTAASGTTVVLDVAANLNDKVWIYQTSPFSVANAVAKTGDTMTGPLGLAASSTAVTPVQFSNNANVATTEFVQRALGNKGNIVSVTGATTLSATQVGSLVVCAVGTYAVTLPLNSSVPLGSAFEIYAGAGATLTITSSGSDVFNQNGTPSTFVIKSGESVKVIAWATGQWAVCGGGSLGRMESFGSSLASPGWQKLPSGLIIQWGADTVTTSTHNVVFPIAFTTTCVSLVVSGQATSTTYFIPYNSVASLTGYSQGFYSNSGASGACTSWNGRYIALGY